MPKMRADKEPGAPQCRDGCRFAAEFCCTAPHALVVARAGCIYAMHAVRVMAHHARDTEPVFEHISCRRSAAAAYRLPAVETSTSFFHHHHPALRSQMNRTIQNYQKAYRKKVEGLKTELVSTRADNQQLRSQVPLELSSSFPLYFHHLYHYMP